MTTVSNTAARLPRARPAQAVATLLALMVLTGCATVNVDDSLARTNREAPAFTGGKLALARNDDDRRAREQLSAELLMSPLSQPDAVQLALANSPSLQALLAQHWADAAGAAQFARLPNPMFSFERLRIGDSLEIGRLLSFGLLDLLTLPQRNGIAERRIEQERLRLSADVVDQVTQVRQAWVRAVAAQQTDGYARQVLANAETGAELARRMQAVGNFNKLDRARQQAFYADAATQLASAQHQATSTREELIRLLGLTDAQALALRLPERLPDLPQKAMQADAVAQAASTNRLDLRMARADLDAAGKAQGLDFVNSFTDIELGVRRNSSFDNASGSRLSGRGFEINLRLPVFDWGGTRRDAMNAQTLAAANRVEATTRAAGSHLRETYSAYRTAHDIARHYRDEVLPLRRTIADENLLRYNGMLIGVFELLADSREQIGSVMAAIAAEQQFWLADAALQASLVGKPTTSAVMAVGGSSGAAEAAH